ncbi:MAG: DUF4349 domain-containing protein [Chloroflexi bacterium]|nr:DUF4349 domain-containing protein [Chloroflexota bacterium]
MNRRLPLLLASLLLLVSLSLAACGGGASESVPTATPRSGQTSDSGNAALPQDRLIVRNGSLTVFVSDVAAAVASLEALASELGGYVVSSRLSGQDAQQNALISFRIPSGRFGEAMDRVRALADKVDNQQTTAQDVTEEYVDLQARLRNLENTEQEFLRLMERAVTVSDVLTMQRELNTVRGQIEQAKGRMQYLEQTSATSLINVTVYPTVAAQPIVRAGWSALETARESLRDLTTFSQGLADVSIRLLIFSPIWLPVLVALVFLLRWQLRREHASGPRPGWTPPPPPQGPLPGPGPAARA